MASYLRFGRTPPKQLVVWKTQDNQQHQQQRREDESDETEIHELKDGAELAKLNAHVEGPTLLWSPMAKLISGATGVGSFYVRAGTKIGGWGVSVGKEATLKSLEISRAVVETVLLATGKDVSSRRSGELGRAEAENMLEKSISMLHSAISTASFVTSFGFETTQTIMNSASTLSIQGLSTLNAVLGSTESSRAVAAIVTLIKNELNRPDKTTGEVATYLDLLAGTIAFVFLQRWGRRKTAIEFRDAGGEEIIWDVVLDDKGFRADVVGTNRKGMLTATKNITKVRSELEDDESNAMILEKGLDLGSQPLALSAEEQTHLSDGEIRDRIMSQLPPGTRATITTDTMTLKKVTVHIHEGETAYIEPPPGLTMVSESLSHGDSGGNLGSSPQQTVVFRTSLTRSSSAEIEPLEKLRITHTTSTMNENGDDDVVMMNTVSPRGPSKFSNDDLRLGITSANDNDKPLPQLPDISTGPLANVKRSRKPAISVNSNIEGRDNKRASKSKRVGELPEPEKEGVLKKALKSLSPSHSLIDNANWDVSISNRRGITPTEQLNPLSQLSKASFTAHKRLFPVHTGASSSVGLTAGGSNSRWEPPGSYFTMHEKKRESTISQTDSFSIHSAESRPSSPTTFRTHTRTTSGLSKTKSHVEMSVQQNSRPETQESRHHRRSSSFVPSLYSMTTKHSDEAIILAPKTPLHKSVFEDHKMLTALASDGIVPGMFPREHLVKIVRRFARFATASYGNSFLRVMGLWTDASAIKSADLLGSDIHHEHNSFSTHTGLPTDCIILSSFFDTHGAASSADATQGVISPLVHFVSADHDQKAIVLTCRGTLGFEDILTDMTFDYDEIHWRGESYHVHKGIHTAARRLLSPLGNRVMSSIKQHLEECPDYGLVLCGHSLGGAVAAIIAILLSEPAKEGSSDASFVTAPMPKLLTASAKTLSAPFVTLPAGRPIHAYAFGSPATVSPALRLATRGLITTIINSNDIVPSLSLGSLHDVRSVALHLKKDTNGHLLQLRSRVLSRVRDAFFSAIRTDTTDRGPPPPANVAGDGLGEDTWAWAELLSLRSCMKSEKLLPPGECFVIETSRVFDRIDADENSPPGTGGHEDGSEANYFRALGRAATRVQFKLIRDVEARFSEVRFGSNMFGDHSPGRYEAALNALEKGVCEN